MKEICFLKDAGRFGLGQVDILLTSEGFWLFVFGTEEEFILGGRYKTLKGAKYEFYRMCIKDKEETKINDLSWYRITTQSIKGENL